MSIQQGWREQYERMQRSYARLTETPVGRLCGASSNDASDALFHFFQDAYHLKDWLIDDEEVALPKEDIEAEVNASQPLRLCADLCNRTKHRRLDERRAPRTGDRETAFVSQSVVVTVGTVESAAAIVVPGGAVPRTGEGSISGPTPPNVYGPSGFTTHRWTVASGGAEWDAVDLAGEVLREWNRLLHAWHQVPATDEP